VTLALSILLHALLGVALAPVVWLAGASAALRLPGRNLANAYAVGLSVVVGAAFLALLSTLLVPLAILGVAAIAWRGARDVDRTALVGAGRSLGRALPGTIAFAFALGLFQHGPTETRASNAFGDLTFYVAELVSAAKSIVPFHDLSLAGFDHTYGQSAPPILGAMLEQLPGFDSFLFYTSTLPALMFAALAIGFGVIEGRPALLPALLVAGAFAYPTWLSESPPVALAAPIGFSLWAFACAPGLVTASLAAAALAVTKGIGILALAALVAAAAVSGIRLRDRRRATLGLLLVGCAIAAVLVAPRADWRTELLVVKFLPADAIDGLRSQFDVRSASQLAPALLVAGHVLLLAGTARLRRPLAFAAVTGGVAAVWFVGGHSADVALVLASILVALELRRRDLDRSTEVLFLAAAACLLAAAWVREVAGLGTAAVLLALGTLALSGPLAAVRVPRLAAAAAATLGIAIGAGFLRLDPASPPLTSEDAGVSRAVAELVPEDALVFTSVTGERVTPDEGWNYYSAVSGRQYFIAGWANSELRVQPEELEERLRLNRLALAGEPGPALAEAGITASRPLYAVLRATDQGPPGARRVYANDRFALYELWAP
jgi:hypothetical protein